VLFPGITGLGLKLTVVPAGTPALADNVIGLRKPPSEVVLNVAFIIAGAGQVADALAVFPNEKLPSFNPGT
jgi:hypothetical protein